jgi:hypothetical protein
VPTFLVESYEPDRGDVRAAARRVAELKEGIRHLRTTFVPEDEIVLHLFEAPSAAALGKAGRQAALPFDRIVEAIDGPPDLREEAR